MENEIETENKSFITRDTQSVKQYFSDIKNLLSDDLLPYNKSGNK